MKMNKNEQQVQYHKYNNHQKQTKISFLAFSKKQDQIFDENIRGIFNHQNLKIAPTWLTIEIRSI